MFAHTCTVCSERYLIFPSQLTGVSPAEDGFVIGFECWCGAAQTEPAGRRTADHRAA
ncbi:hypothetical protein [Nocardioides sp.]|uniref:hypothetical protein n=1 Tax=Nocardioides sp. TaxID=35761 RepID=UPI002728CE7F|nr:hypothetical protein [Nocardioides sp.]MDO9454799.1 hypothetical protein [Nocardioides sp.]